MLVSNSLEQVIRYATYCGSLVVYAQMYKFFKTAICLLSLNGGIVEQVECLKFLVVRTTVSRSDQFCGTNVLGITKPDAIVKGASKVTGHGL